MSADFIRIALFMRIHPHLQITKKHEQNMNRTQQKRILRPFIQPDLVLL